MLTTVLGLLLLFLAAVALVLAPPRCSHTDPHGRPTLAWSTRNGRLCGFCFECQQWTAGWPITAAARSWWKD